MSRRDPCCGGGPALRVLIAAVFVLGSCTSKPAGSPGASQPGPSGTAGSGSPGGAALVSTLPSGCDAPDPAAGAVVTFVAGGRAWAVSPDDGRTLTCLFEVSAPGVFSWGPLGDRVALRNLEVRGVGNPVSRPAVAGGATYFSWSRPTGTTVVFTKGDRHTLMRADMGTAGARDITPVPGKTYGDMGPTTRPASRSASSHRTHRDPRS